MKGIREINQKNHLDAVVATLISQNEFSLRISGWEEKYQSLPSKEIISSITEDLRGVFFPGYSGNPELNTANNAYYIGATLERVQRNLAEQVRRGLCFDCQTEKECPLCEARSRKITMDFIEILPSIQIRLIQDVKAAFTRDPAATGYDEAIFSYPGIHAVTNYRIAHELHRLRVPFIPRIITELAHSQTGIDIHPGAQIGESFFIDHGTGVVIGETSVIGKNVQLFQGVTLGAKSFPLDEHGNPIKGIPRHPILEDDVIIYAGATILGRITIGKGSVIGGNVWVTRDIPANCRISQTSYRFMEFESGTGI